MAKARRGSSRSSGFRLLRALERTFGVGIIVQAVDEGPPVTIDALVLYGGQREEIHGTGETEAAAWHALGSAIAMWRAANDKHVTMWPGGL